MVQGSLGLIFRLRVPSLVAKHRTVLPVRLLRILPFICCGRGIRTPFQGYEPCELPLLYHRDIKKCFILTNQALEIFKKSNFQDILFSRTEYLLQLYEPKT